MAKASVTTQQREILREEKGFSSRHARYTLRVLQSHDGAGGGREGVEVTGVLRIVAAAVLYLPYILHPSGEECNTGNEK